MSQGHFTLIEYNNFLLNLPLESYEVGDRPMAVQITSEKLTGKAMSISLHIKLMPFILWWLLPAKREMESCLLDIVIILNKINEYLLADSFTLGDIQDLEDLLVDYFDLRKACAEEYATFAKTVPKHHYLEHYPSQIEACGPFTVIWTARCEQRHRDFVNQAESAKNFINLLKTLVDKEQLRVCSR